MTASRPTTIQAPEPCPALGEHAINGDPDILAVERAIGELRRGRVLGVSEQQRVRLVAAVETLHADTFARFVTAAGGDIRLALSAERCRALGLSQLTTEAMTLALPGEIDLDRLRALSGLDATNGLPAVTARASPASITERAMVALTAQMPLIPAVVVAGETHVGGDPSLLVVSLAAVAHYQRRCGKQLSIASRARVPLSGEENCELVLFRDAHADRGDSSCGLGAGLRYHRPR